MISSSGAAGHNCGAALVDTVPGAVEVVRSGTAIVAGSAAGGIPIGDIRGENFGANTGVSVEVGVGGVSVAVGVGGVAVEVGVGGLKQRNTFL